MKDWYQFEAHLSQLRAYGLAESIKDLYWDIRPKPEFGTVEIRVCDTPLTVERAARSPPWPRPGGAADARARTQ